MANTNKNKNEAQNKTATVYVSSTGKIYEPIPESLATKHPVADAFMHPADATAWNEYDSTERQKHLVYRYGTLVMADGRKTTRIQIRYVSEEHPGVCLSATERRSVKAVELWG